MIGKLNGVRLYDDYAHHPEEIKATLMAAKQWLPGRRITAVFQPHTYSRTKALFEGFARAFSFADRVIITSDNPRSEDPKVIAEAICAGFSSSAHYEVELDRYQAIYQAISMAQEGDSILIAGRGHESHQIFSHLAQPFDDRQMAAEICQGIAQLPIAQESNQAGIL